MNSNHPDISQRSRHERAADALNNSARFIQAAARSTESQRHSGNARSIPGGIPVARPIQPHISQELWTMPNRIPAKTFGNADGAIANPFTKNSMKRIVVLLLARDLEVKRQAAVAAAASGVCLTVARTVDEALQTVCARRRDLDLVVIDFDQGNRGMTLLSALSMVSADLPILALISTDGDHSSVVTCGNKAALCLTKPINSAEFEIVIRALGDAKSSVKPIWLTEDRLCKQMRTATAIAAAA
jgi:CheY-like chemotaxis protein